MSAYGGSSKNLKDLTGALDPAITGASAAITAYDAATDNYAANKLPYEDELTSIDNDIELIKELLRMIETLHAEPASTTDTTSSEGKAEQQARLAASVLKIQKLALRIKSPTAQVGLTRFRLAKLARPEVHSPGVWGKSVNFCSENDQSTRLGQS
jgi:hypothetical protein